MENNQSDILRFRCKPAIKAAVDKEADRQMITPSQYARRAVVQRLQADGAIAARAVRSKPTREAEFA
jgi:hypothetical protein